jgi:hypothetical protein
MELRCLPDTQGCQLPVSLRLLHLSYLLLSAYTFSSFSLMIAVSAGDGLSEEN